MTLRGILFAVIILLLATGAVLASIRVLGTEKVFYLEPDQSGPDPFTPPAVFTSDSPPPPAPIDPSVTITTPSNPPSLGDNPGPVGANVKKGECDPELLIQYLNSRPERRAAWLQLVGVAVEEFEDYLRSATPALLSRDTRVTSYGFRSGEAVALQAILAAGTSVLADENDDIVVRCYSGSPLKPPRKMDRYNCDGCPADLPPPPACAKSCFAVPSETPAATSTTSTTQPAQTTTTPTTTTRPPGSTTTRRRTRATTTTRRSAARPTTTTFGSAAGPTADANFFSTQPRTFAPAAPPPPTTQPPTSPPTTGPTAPTFPITSPTSQTGTQPPTTQAPTQPTSTTQDCELGILCL
jgi:hypothetical protein